MASGRSWADVGKMDSLMDVFPGLLEISGRESDCLDMNNIQLPAPFLALIDVSQAEDRIADARPGLSQCITPAGRLLHTQKCRFAFGIEKLNIQGISFDDEDLLATESDSLLSSLAGNSFEARCNAASLLVLCMLSAMAGSGPSVV